MICNQWYRRASRCSRRTRDRSLGDLSLDLGAAACLDTPRDGAVDVVVRDPALVVVFVGARGWARRLGAGSGLRNGSLLLLLGRLGARGFGEEGLDPGLVDKVDGGAEQAREEEVEEDTATLLADMYCSVYCCGERLTSGGRRSWWVARRSRRAHCAPEPGRLGLLGC
jgi:hypothetical protein